MPPHHRHFIQDSSGMFDLCAMSADSNEERREGPVAFALFCFGTGCSVVLEGQPDRHRFEFFLISSNLPNMNTCQSALHERQQSCNSHGMAASGSSRLVAMVGAAAS